MDITGVRKANVVTVVSIECCGKAIESSVETQVEVANGGKQLDKLVCSECGATYITGVMVAVKFVPVTQEQLDEVGIEKMTPDEMAELAAAQEADMRGLDGGEDVRMCARCDGSCSPAERCAGCREFVHRACREREPQRAARHAVEEHWIAPKTALAEAVDDGSTISRDDDDFIAEA